VIAGIRRYVAGSAAIAALALVPVLVTIPWLIRILFGPDYSGADSAARLILVAAAIQLVFSWTKTFPVTIGRPGLRLIAHGVETVVMLPLIIVFGKEWGVTGAGGAVLVSSVAFALTWGVIVWQLRRTGGFHSSVTTTEQCASAESASSRTENVRPPGTARGTSRCSRRSWRAGRARGERWRSGPSPCCRRG